MTDKSLTATAKKVASVRTFMWMDSIAKLQTIPALIDQVPCGQIAGLVVFDLPGRDCAAKASNRELTVGVIEYIDHIRKILLARPDTALALIVEPDSLPNLVTKDDLTTRQ
ncbi:MAG: hypothetical protein MMC23_001398 [Stictis urceolatum]|nr:hypothetical protein [Stictis urceolata]